MKNYWKLLVLVFVVLALGSVPFLIGAKSGTEMPNEDGPVVKVAEAEQPASEQEIQIRNEKLIEYFASRHGSGKLTKDMVNMKKPIRNISWVEGQNKTRIRIRYKDDSFSEYTVDNK